MAIRIETERLILRQFVIEDLDDVFRFGSHPEVNKYTGDNMSSIEDAERAITNTWHGDYKRHGYGRLAVEVKGNKHANGRNIVIGFCGLKFLPEFERPDIGYRFLPEYWGQGIATESARASLKHARESLGLKNIMGIAMVENLASQNVLEKLDFKVVERTLFDGHDVFIYDE